MCCGCRSGARTKERLQALDPDFASVGDSWGQLEDSQQAASVVVRDAQCGHGRLLRRNTGGERETPPRRSRRISRRHRCTTRS
eukprot:7383176-Prymnesium_polylepis.2